MGTAGGLVLLVLLLVLAVFFYFVPTIVAIRRRHRNRMAVLVLNLALGWTLLGWVVALVWANTSDVEPEPQEALGLGLVGAQGGNSAAGVVSSSVAARSQVVPAPAAAAERVCPFCAETVKAAAIVCKHCGRDLEPMVAAPEVVPDLAEQARQLGVTWSPEIQRYIRCQ